MLAKVLTLVSAMLFLYSAFALMYRHPEAKPAPAALRHVAKTAATPQAPQADDDAPLQLRDAVFRSEDDAPAADGQRAAVPRGPMT